ncbi:hypothetical protein GCM10010123_06470 [Pilimelia anulata]|uniref:FAD-binding domain-containing protein n=1 Tax=Pilimelia anulata TaxID=53371 RepID=A0A8J3F7Q9_9ACTN|nr:FAD-dependent monooxygenase [Pilimelia anulata]GGJ79243.1 hypothetical protein GCM10010123_06470 [Pilimelia anulata]
MTAPPPAPVVVVGNGPVGQTTALLLARWGVPSIVVDARPARAAIGSRAICQARDVLDIWAAVGAGRRIAAEGVTWTTARTYHRGRELAAWSFVDHGRSPLPPMVNISQSRTEQVLAERVAAGPLIDERWSHEVTDIAQDAAGVTLTCATPAGPVLLRAGYAVLAAGAHSRPLRERLDVDFAGESYDDRFLICDIRADLPDRRTERRFHFDPPGHADRQVLVHPCPDRTYRIDWQVPPDFDADADAASGGLDRRVRSIVGDVPAEVVWRTVYRFHARCADRLRVGRVLLAGDCAHLVAPFGARGLNSGVPDAENAAWKLAFVLRGWAPPELLASFDAERRAAALENLAVTGATMRFLAPQNPADERRRRDILDRARTDPDARRLIDSGRFAEPFWYVDSPLTTPDPDRPFPGRPPRGHPPAVAPGVLVPDAPIRRPAAAGVPGAAYLGAAAGFPGGSGDPPGPGGSGGWGDPVDRAGPAGPTGDSGWLRGIVRDGILLLTTDGITADAVAGELAGLAAPIRVLPLAAIDPGGDVAAALGARPGEVWLIRPDGHLGAVLTRPREGAARAAVRRVLGYPSGPT